MDQIDKLEIIGLKDSAKLIFRNAHVSQKFKQGAGKKNII
jgi:hypothetical protein